MSAETIQEALWSGYATPPQKGIVAGTERGKVGVGGGTKRQPKKASVDWLDNQTPTPPCLNLFKSVKVYRVPCRASVVMNNSPLY